MAKKICLLFTLILCFISTPNTAFAQDEQEQPFRESFVDFNPYAANLQDKILNNWNPKTKGKKRNTVISISIDHDGVIQDVTLQKSSKDKFFDYDATDAIVKAVPFEPLPDSFQEKTKNIQLNFIYEQAKDKTSPIKYIIANISNQEGYDEYIKNVNDIVYTKLYSKAYFQSKDAILTLNINKKGKLIYAKVKDSSTKDNRYEKKFNREVIEALQKTQFPPIPDKMGLNYITLDFRLLTQRKYSFSGFLCEYVFNFFRTGLESFCVQNAQDI